VRTDVLRPRHDVRHVPSAARPGGPGPRARARYAVHQRNADAADARHSLRIAGLFRHGDADRAVRLRRVGSAGQVPAARRGDRAMNDLPLWAAAPAAVLLVIAGVVTLVGSLALVRLPDFFTRIHGPAMGNTVGTGSVLIASMLVSSAIASRPVLHELLITLFIVMSSPVTAMLLMQAARYRNKVKGRD